MSSLLASWLQQETKPVICLCEATTNAGSLTLQYEGGRWFLSMAGATVLEVLDPEDGASGTFRNNLSQTGLAGDYMRVVFGYCQSENLLFLQIANNSVATFLASNRTGTSGIYPVVGKLVSLTSVSAITVGSRIDGSLSLGAQWLKFSAYDPASMSGNPPELILVIGDSVEAALSYNPGVAAAACAGTPTHIYTPAQAAAFSAPRILNQSIGGATIATQKATFLSSAQSLVAGNGFVGVIICVGLNNFNAGESASSAIAEYQDLINTVRSTIPRAKVLARLLTPCRGWLGDTKWAQLVVFNNAMQGGLTFSGIDYVITAHYAPLDGGGGFLAAAYDSGDGVHPIDSGRAIIGSAERGGLSALGLL
jgi:GDSL-like Lipase/Acylhydrolase family